MPDPTLAENYFALEPLLLARVEATFGAELKGYFGLAETADLTLRSLPIPSLQLVFNRDVLPAGTPAQHQGEDQLVRQQWTFWLALRNHRQTRGNKLRMEAGPLYRRLIDALAGQKLGPDFSHLRRVNGPGPRYLPTVIFLPATFETRLVTFQP